MDIYSLINLKPLFILVSNVIIIYTMTDNKLRAALDGCNGKISLKGKQIYHYWMSGSSPSILGQKLNKNEWIQHNITDEQYTDKIQWLLADWEPYENGWLVTTGDSGKYRNNHLFYYKCQMGNYGSHRPQELDYLTQ